MCLAVHRQTQAQIEKKIDKMTLDSMYARKQAVSIGVKCTIVIPKKTIESIKNRKFILPFRT